MPYKPNSVRQDLLKAVAASAQPVTASAEHMHVKASDLYTMLAEADDATGREGVLAKAQSLSNARPDLRSNLIQTVRDLGYYSNELPAPDNYAVPASSNKLIEKNKQKPKKNNQQTEPIKYSSQERWGRIGEKEKTANQIMPDIIANPRNVKPVNPVMSQEKFNLLKTELKTKGWVGRPVLAFKDGSSLQAVTGSHRLHAAKATKTKVPVKLIPSYVHDFEDDEGNELKYLWGTGDDERLANFLEKAGSKEAARLMSAEKESDDREGDLLYGGTSA